MTASNVSSERETAHERWWSIRRIAAVVVAAIAAAAVALSYQPTFWICREQLATSGVAVRVCGPVGLEDLPLLGAMLAVVVLLMLPDISEIGVGGVSIRRRLRQQSRESARLGDEILHLELRRFFPRDLARIATDIENKAMSGAPPPEPGDIAAAAVWTAERQSRIDTIRELLRRVDRALEMSDGARVPGEPDLTDAELRSLRDWKRRYAEDVQDFKAATNLLARWPFYFSENDLRSLEAIGDRLLWALANVGITPS